MPTTRSGRSVASAREIAVDGRRATLGELEADLAPDCLVACLDAHLRDPGAHRPQADDSDSSNLHGARSYFASASISFLADSNCSVVRRICECLHRLCGKMPAASTGGASCRSATTVTGLIA